MDCDFVLKDRESTALLIKGVRTELGGNEALDMGFGRGLNQEKLSSDSNGGEGRDKGFLAFECVGERVEGVIVNWDGGDGGGKVMRAALAGKYCDFEASMEELVEDCWAEIASRLREKLASVT